MDQGNKKPPNHPTIDQTEGIKAYSDGGNPKGSYHMRVKLSALPYCERASYSLNWLALKWKSNIPFTVSIFLEKLVWALINKNYTPKEKGCVLPSIKIYGENKAFLRKNFTSLEAPLHCINCFPFSPPPNNSRQPMCS